MLTEAFRQKVIKAQRGELSEYLIYGRLIKDSGARRHAETLKKIAEDELKHHDFFKSLSGQDVRPYPLKVWWYVFLARLLGLNFALRLLESGEDLVQEDYNRLREISSGMDEIIRDEKEHEIQLLGLLDEERLAYAGSMVLGLNDALVELTGALVGFTLALQKTRLVAIVGLITGIAASMSMAAAEYLSTKHEDTGKNPLKASLYTGMAYVLTVVVLILPYFLFTNIYLCLAWVVCGALLVVFLFTYYISVAKGLNFKARFLEMAGLSVSIAAVNFAFGLLIRKVFGIEV
ncbi:MAG: VIT1/CCC1 transporter family protein [Candidatus Omnitrophota bacterium]